MIHRRHLLFLLLPWLTLLGCAQTPGCPETANSACTRVLFVGNSYTFVNDLPGTFARLARSGGHKVDVAMAANGGWSLADHASSAETTRVITSKHWDEVILQEQSEIPSVRQLRESKMYPAARKLVQLVQRAGAHPVFFVTWAHRDGLPQDGLGTYDEMQTAIDDAYLAIADEQAAAVAPVGFAWSSAGGGKPDRSLWQDDGSHPTRKGTYLAACVFFATLFEESPIGLMYRGGLPDNEALQLQRIARDTVLGNAGRWHLAVLDKAQSR